MAELARSVSLNGLEDLLASTRTCVALLDGAGRFLISNPAFRALQQGASPASSIFDLIRGGQKELMQSGLQPQADGPTTQVLRLDFQTGSQLLPFDCRISRLEGGDFLLFAEPASGGGLSGDSDRMRAELDDVRTALAHKDVELRAVIAQADELAHTDALTFLPNRRMIVAEIQREVTRAERYSSPLTISMLDLDTFKYVNDTYGHAAGDDVLRSVTKELRAHIRQPDEIGRYGGDEFLVILPNSAASAAAEQASRLCERVRSMKLLVGDAPVHLTMSAGIAQLKRSRENWQTLLERADRALYEAKAAGGNQWKISEG